MRVPTHQEFKRLVFQTFKAPAWFLPNSISYSSTADRGFQRVTVKREEYVAHPSLNLAVTKQQLQEPDLSLTLPFMDNMAPSICICLADWMLQNTFEVVCFEPEATQELMYIRWGILRFKVMQSNGVWGYKQDGKLLQGKISALTVQPFHQAAAW